ncbi:MAG: ATP-binding protein [Deltaproteobacteria bacterium]|nr:ATP-binding protein [Deltaproteobacteria bacterium]
MIEILPEIESGLQEFEGIRNTKKLYVDKTAYLLKLRKFGKIIFLARPRRFGKTLTITTLKAFYSGKKELFVGLEAEEYLNSADFTPKPVISLDMSRLNTENIDLLKKSTVNLLGNIASSLEIPLRGESASDNFQNLIIDLKKTTSKNVVLLIDEYDAPIIKLTQNNQTERDNGLIKSASVFFQEFYQMIKSCEAELDFTFITGVTKFTRMSVFSVLNNLNDISLEPKFGAIVGFTHEELTANFAPHIEAAAKELGMTDRQLTDKIREYYDGFSFDGETRLYNPYSTLCFFKQSVKYFDPFWMESGSDRLIRDKIKDWNLTPESFESSELSRSFIKYPGEIGNTTPIGFLYQAGYLSLRLKPDGNYRTVWPNQEVRETIKRLFLATLYTKDDDTFEKDILKLSDYLNSMNIPQAISVIKRQLASLSYERYDNALSNSKSSEDSNKETKSNDARLEEPSAAGPDSNRVVTDTTSYNEFYYRNLIQMCLETAGCFVSPERHTSHGRCDLAVRCKNQNLIIEFKIKRKNERASTVAERGLQQIIDKRYDGPYVNPILIGLAIDSEEKNIAAFAYQKGETKETIVFDYPKVTGKTQANRDIEQESSKKTRRTSKKTRRTPKKPRQRM